MSKKVRISIVLVVSVFIAALAGVGVYQQASVVESVLQITPAEPAKPADVRKQALAGVRGKNKPDAKQVENLEKSKTWVGADKGGYFQLPDYGHRKDVVSAQSNDNLQQNGTFTQTFAEKSDKIFVTHTKVAAKSQIAQQMNQDVTQLAQQSMQSLQGLKNLSGHQLNKDAIVLTGYSDTENKKQGQVKEFISIVFVRDSYGNLHMYSVESRQDKESVAKNIATLTTLAGSRTEAQPDGISFSKHVQK
ncbi:hypothetical protein JOC36_000090 [Weissella uvarum]|uniref:hypothetical protein n=1 Tax=Weissella uvarum TaxID=1479233 RepID=UPI00196103B3|nr:hypothetical protein [Weissella uvarum]MBM7616557.1 hypothetical protein [Weissella uvarum]MCM0594983.1 hypothetical protein [Weissella uvarum]